MKIDKEFNTLLIKYIFCDDNTSYTGYSGALQKTKSVQKLITYVLDKVNASKNINITSASQLSFSISNDDPDMLDIYISIGDVDIDIDQIMIPINLNNINNSPDWILLFPGDEEIKL